MTQIRWACLPTGSETETTVSLNIGSCPLQVEIVSREVDRSVLTLILYDQKLSALSLWIKDQGCDATPPSPHLCRSGSHCIVSREESLLDFTSSSQLSFSGIAMSRDGLKSYQVTPSSQRPKEMAFREPSHMQGA